jgi:protein-S-isoprenylcysteine O-methyltransferase Ste14
VAIIHSPEITEIGQVSEAGEVGLGNHPVDPIDGHGKHIAIASLGFTHCDITSDPPGKKYLVTHKRGVAGILTAAGMRPSVQNRAILSAALMACIAGFVTVHLLLTLVLRFDLPLVQVGCWLTWLSWVGWIFPAAMVKRKRSDPSGAYRHGLFRHIIPGFAAIVTITSAPALIPMFAFAKAGDWSDLGISSWWEFMVASAVFAFGFAALISGVAAIGFPAAAFVDEYSVSPPPHIPVGVFRVIRHPIAVGGLLMPAAAALHGGFPLELWLINIAMLAVYGPIEDLRLRKVFGKSNNTYMTRVPRFVPIPNFVRSSAMSAVQALQIAALRSQVWGFGRAIASSRARQLLGF